MHSNLLKLLQIVRLLRKYSISLSKLRSECAASARIYVRLVKKNAQNVRLHAVAVGVVAVVVVVAAVTVVGALVAVVVVVVVVVVRVVSQVVEVVVVVVVVVVTVLAVVVIVAVAAVEAAAAVVAVQAQVVVAEAVAAGLLVAVVVAVVVGLILVEAMVDEGHGGCGCFVDFLACCLPLLPSLQKNFLLFPVPLLIPRLPPPRGPPLSVA